MLIVRVAATFNNSESGLFLVLSDSLNYTPFLQKSNVFGRYFVG